MCVCVTELETDLASKHVLEGVGSLHDVREIPVPGSVPATNVNICSGEDSNLRV